VNDLPGGTVRGHGWPRRAYRDVFTACPARVVIHHKARTAPGNKNTDNNQSLSTATNFNRNVLPSLGQAI
jgi:hypothetical protein